MSSWENDQIIHSFNNTKSLPALFFLPLPPRSLAHATSEPVLWPFASLSRTRMGRAPGFVIVGFAEHEPVFTTD